jgi:hypothetical protein
MGIKVFAGLVLSVAGLPAQTVTPEAAGLPALRGVYLHSPAGWLGLPDQPLMPFENGTAKWLLGFGKSDAIADFPGPHAAVQTSQVKPTFYLRGFPPTSGIYLIREVQKAGHREVHMPVSRDFIEWAHLKSSDLVAIETRHAGDNVTALTPRENLKPGEYGIVTAFDPNVDLIRVIFDFGVNP